MTPFEALKAATVNPAKALALDAGTIEAGKLADLIMVDGDPLANIANAHKVRRVIANGRVYEMEQLLFAPQAQRSEERSFKEFLLTSWTPSMKSLYASSTSRTRSSSVAGTNGFARNGHSIGRCAVVASAE